MPATEKTTMPSAAETTEPQYPAEGEVTRHRHMTACEVLCWIGYHRPIRKEVYFAPIKTMAPGATIEELAASLHHSVPEPKPPECPLNDAERKLMDALRLGSVQALIEKNGKFEEVPAAIYEYAMAVNVRGSIEPDGGATERDATRADLSQRPIGSVFFRTSEVLKVWPKEATALALDPTTNKRRSNGLDYRAKDAWLFPRMRALINDKKARSPEDAARWMLEDAAGRGRSTDASIVRRLAKHYREQS
jgi:hypothetical protein